MAEQHFEHGSMDVRLHEKTFENFIKIVQRAVIAIVLILTFLAIFNT